MSIPEDIHRGAFRIGFARGAINVASAATMFILGVCALFVLYGLVHYFLFPAQYVFGTEVSGWMYSLRTVFVLSASGELILALLALFGSRVIAPGRVPTIMVRLVVILIFIVVHIV